MAIEYAKASPEDILCRITAINRGDLTLAESRAAWPEKLFWSNINVSAYQLPRRELQALILERVQAAAPDGRRLAFEISGALQDNWQASIPLVLEALEETRTA